MQKVNACTETEKKKQTEQKHSDFLSLCVHICMERVYKVSLLDQIKNLKYPPKSTAVYEL